MLLNSFLENTIFDLQITISRIYSQKRGVVPTIQPGPDFFWNAIFAKC